ncbi:MAG: hypothetical protein ACRYGP_09050 [Janthinobacterium lividum]
MDLGIRHCRARGGIASASAGDVPSETSGLLPGPFHPEPSILGRIISVDVGRPSGADVSRATMTGTVLTSGGRLGERKRPEKARLSR